MIVPLLFACKSRDAVKIDYEKYTLDNGLEVVLHEDHSDPVVAVAIQFHVGSSREKPGKTGFAHFFEHMLFQRSEHLPRNSFFEKIAAMGGEFNGGTGQDGTIYYEAVPRDGLEKILWMESDRMGFFVNTVTQAGLEREIDVILNEKRQTADNTAYGQIMAILSKEMYPEGHPYSWAVIGEMDDIRSATIEDVKDFYHTYYVPQNATLCIAGDFDPVETKAMVEKYFGEIAKGNDVPVPQPQPAVLESIRKVYYEDPFAPFPFLLRVYPTAEMNHEDEQALSVLSQLLAGSKKSPLYRTLVSTGLAQEAYSANWSQEIAGMTMFQVPAYPGVSLDSVDAGIEEGLRLFESEGINPESLEAVKASIETGMYGQLSSVLNKAMTLAQTNEFCGKPDAFTDQIEDLKSVTAEDVMRVYEKYIKGHNYLSISMVPQGSAALAVTGGTPARVTVEKVDDASSSQMSSQAGAIVDDDYEFTPSSFDRSIEPAYLPNTPESNIPAIWNASLDNGMALSGITHDEIPMVNFSIIIKGGHLLDPAGKPGVAYLNARMMNNGTALRTPEDLETALDILGAMVNVYAGKDRTTISGSCLSRNFGKTLRIVEEMILQPRFDEEYFEIEKNNAISMIQSDRMDPDAIARDAMGTIFFGEGNPYSTAVYGTEESIASITVDDLKNYYENYMSPVGAAFLIAGDIDEASCKSALSSLVNDWKGEAVTVTRPDYGRMEGSEGELYFIDFPGAMQSSILVFGEAPTSKDPDFPKLQVANFRLGSGSNGMLFKKLRLERGYTYGAYSSFVTSPDYGYFMATSSVQAAATEPSVGLFREILGGYGDNFTQEMLDQTKDALIRQNAFAFETNYNLLDMLTTSFVGELPQDFVKQQEDIIRNTTVEDIREICDEYLNPDELSIVVVGDAKTQKKNFRNAKSL